MRTATVEFVLLMLGFCGVLLIMAWALE